MLHVELQVEVQAIMVVDYMAFLAQCRKIDRGLNMW
jgi:hypothetical protein